MLAETIFSGFVSKVVNECVDVSKDRIKEAKRNRNNKHQNLQSQLYNVMIDTLNKLTNNRYEDRDILYDTAENLLKEFQNARINNVDVVKNALHNLVMCVNNGEYSDFINALCCELAKEQYVELYREIILLQEEQKNKKTLRIESKVDTIGQKMEKGFDAVKREIENISNARKETVIDIGNKIKNNKKQDYIKIWNNRLFLHQGENAKPITLQNAFIMPDFIIQKCVKSIGFIDSNTLDEIIDAFVKYERTSTLLITGVPGVGKTTITSWLADKYKTNDSIIILRFRDWEYQELRSGLINAICNTLECKKKDLEEKIIVLDGFDEMKALDFRDQLIDDLYNDIKDIKNAKFIITSRPAYINMYYIENALVLKEFDIVRIDQFCEILTGNVLENKEKVESNLEVLGIPVILYMAIMSEIDISENPTKPELYNRIFAEKGGIFDKFFDGENEYSAGSQIMRNPNNIKKYLEFLREISFMMFEKGNTLIKIRVCKIPKLQYLEKSVSVLEFPLKHLFETTENNIEFIHKSIYEYFVSEYFYKLLYEIINKNVSEEKLAGFLGHLLKDSVLSIEILDYLKYKVRSGKLSEKADFIKKVFYLMMRDGMTYYTKKCYKKVITYEKKIFSNMLKILYIWEESYNLRVNSYLLELLNNNNYLETIILNSVCLDGIILKNVKLVKAQLCGATICDSILTGVELCGANLEGATIENTIFCKAIFTGANLRKAKLCRVDLTDADLSNTDFREAILDRFRLCGANLENSIWNVDDVGKIYPQLYNTHFKNIIITSTDNQKAVNRKDYLSKKSLNDFMDWLCDELKCRP